MDNKTYDEIHNDFVHSNHTQAALEEFKMAAALYMFGHYPHMGVLADHAYSIVSSIVGGFLSGPTSFNETAFFEAYQLVGKLLLVAKAG